MDLPAHDVDVAIVGAGPVGCALALLLARVAPHPQRIALVGRAAPAARGGDGAADPRTLAVNHGSRVLLEQLDAWPAVAASIETVHVSQRGRLGRTLIRHEELGVPRLGSVAGYDALLSAMTRAVAASPVRFIEAQKPEVHRGAQAAGIDLGQERLSCGIVVQSDGSRPAGLHRDYGQEAVLACVRAERPQRGWAYERFTNEGPLALLPHPAGDGLYSLVWCCTPQHARQLRDMGPAEFAAALQQRYGDRLGRLSLAGERHVFPLSLHAGPTLPGPRTVAIGNAAQTLHPVAGQGLNLGLRDAAQLAQALAPWLLRPQSDPASLLRRFAEGRRADRWLTAGITDLLPRVFATRLPPVEHACGLALLALDLSAGLRLPLARHLMQGLRG
ncbi:FAD-dependent monooxygenase [Candidimonas humi]|uniref:FAD-dependent monooxygenase n=1 Tax=Candidimonas humi TaxID=683355 RepID=A0ABV8NWZ9_9BURK|nr:FAD-dependent monooxygenase [Candidimonas humi]MBV6304815.1 FAD-dependent monooxygenase [Candidimonas humi]